RCQLGEQLVSFARALADPGEDGYTRMPLDRRTNELHDEHGLADTRTTKHRGLAALDQGREQVDGFDARVEALQGSAAPLERGSFRVDGPARDVGRESRTAVGSLADYIQQPPEHRLADRHANGQT